MNTQDFLQRIHDVSIKDGYSLFSDEGSFEKPQEMSIGKQLIVRTMMQVAVGYLAFQNSGFYKQHDNIALMEDLKRLQKHCDLIGLKDCYGQCHLRVIIFADDISDESLVGRSAIIHEQAHNFQKYSMTLMKTRFREIKYGVVCYVYLTFSTHKRAREFFENHITKCKHTAFWKKIRTRPCVVDLEDEVIQDHSGKKLEKLSGPIFKGQQITETTAEEEDAD